MIILASNSLRRKQLLEDQGIKIKIIPSNFDESKINDLDPEVRVKKLAFSKAYEVYKNNKNETIIAADTLVFANGKFFGKPKNFEEEIKMLKTYSGNYHYVYTGVCIFHNHKEFIFADKTKVFFRKMENEEMIEYANTNEPYDKAGGYAIQGIARKFIEFFDGDELTVVGLPVNKVVNELNKIGAI